MRIIDLSVALKAGIASDPPNMLPSIEYRDHKAGGRRIRGTFPGLKPEQLPDSEGAAIERITITTHNGTHLDAPWHFASTMDGGKPALKIDQVPLEWFFSPGVKLDFRSKPDGYVCKADDVKRELDRIGYTLKPLDIVLVNTAAGARLRPTELHRQRLRHGPRGHPLSDQARRARHRHRRLELGRAVLVHPQAIYRDRRCQPHLGRPQSRPRDRLLPHGKARQSRSVAAVRLQGLLLSGENPRRFRRLDALRGVAGRLQKSARSRIAGDTIAQKEKTMDSFSFGPRDDSIIQIAYTVADIQEGNAPLQRTPPRRPVVFDRPVRAAERRLSRHSRPRCGSALGSPIAAKS